MKKLAANVLVFIYLCFVFLFVTVWPIVGFVACVYIAIRVLAWLGAFG